MTTLLASLHHKRLPRIPRKIKKFWRKKIAKIEANSVKQRIERLKESQFLEDATEA